MAAALYPSYPAADLIRTIETVGRERGLRGESEDVRGAARGKVEHWFLLTGEAEGAMSLAALRASGRNAMDADAALTERLRARVSPADPAILYLTSGATGEPKMALVTHEAIVANIDMGRPFCRSARRIPRSHFCLRRTSRSAW